MMLGAKPWSDFAVGAPSTLEGWTEPDCMPLTTISHVTHVRGAIDIVCDGHLSPSLVYDKSKLNSSRITVNWLSPNDWDRGFRYGNVRFVFDWEQIVAVPDVRFYWVEVIDYQPKACRILVTRNDYDSDGGLLRYDPSVGSGPWWWDKDNNQHFWNGKICLEIMIEAPLGFSRCIGTDFVRHHPHQCCIDPAKCPDRGRSAESAGAEFLAGVLAENLELSHLKLVSFDDKPVSPLSSVWAAWNHLWERLKIRTYTGSITSRDAASDAITRAILAAFSRKNEVEARHLTALFTSEIHFQACYDRVFRFAFDKEFPRIDPADVPF